MMVPAICPCCGADIRVDEPVTIDDFTMGGDGHPLFYRGKPIRFTGHESAICWSLMKAYPQIISRDALLMRIGSEDCVANVVSVYVHRIRSRLGMMGIPDPILTVHGKGFRWLSNREMCE